MRTSALSVLVPFVFLACRGAGESVDVSTQISPTFGAPGLAAAMVEGGAFYENPQGTWSVGLRAEAWGREGALVRLDATPAVFEGETARRSWTGLEEWYQPHADGVKHGFDLFDRPSGEGLLQVWLGIDTPLDVTGDDTEVRFLDENGDLALAYRDLVVFDAEGTELDSWMELDGDALVLAVDDTDAAWPLWIDPLVVPPVPGDAVFDIVIQNNSGRPWSEGVAAILPAAAADDALIQIGLTPTSGNPYFTYGFLHRTCDPATADEGDGDLLITNWTTLTDDDNAFLVPALAVGASTTLTIQASPGEVLSYAAFLTGTTDDAVIMNAAGDLFDPTIDLFDGTGAPLTTLSYDISGYDVNSASSTNGAGPSCASTCPPPATGCFVAPGNGTGGVNLGGDQTGGGGCREFDVYIDGDGDGFGGVLAGPGDTPGCTATPGFSLVDGDCADDDPDISPDDPEIPGNGIDEDCDGEIELVAGNLVINELMINPESSTSEANGEWFEVYNPTDFDIDMDDFVISRGSSSFTVNNSGANPDTTVGAGEYFVFGRGSNTNNNGDYDPDYDYTNGFRLRDGGDTLTITADTVVVDAVTWTAAVVHNGASLQLDPGSADSVSNDDLDNFCDGFTAYGDGDFATPGTVNDPCAFTIVFDFVWVFTDGLIVDENTTLVADGDGRFTTGNLGEGTYTRTTSAAGQRLSWTYDNTPNVVYEGFKPFGGSCWPAMSTMTGFDPLVVASGEWGELGCP